MVRITVKSHTGETPWKYAVGPKWYDVADVMDRWRAPDHEFFKVACKDGSISILRRTDKGGAWDLVSSSPSMPDES